jgi:hypothetical protein
MSSFNIKKSLVQKKERSYLNRDFDSFRAELLRYATTYYPDRMQDYSEGSLGSMFNDLASYVGDVMSFYLDHQFNELNLETAVEPNNIERQIRLAGVKITGAAPAICNVDFSIKVESELFDGSYRPKNDYLPIVRSKTKLQASNGVIFELLEDLNFADVDETGALVANVQVSTADSSGNPLTYILTRSGICSSGETVQENVTIPNTFVPFRTVTLSRNNVSEILKVIDSDLNEYYEVTSLSNDVVFKRVVNTGEDSESVPDALLITPAPYRFATRTSLNTAQTTLVFGSGRADTLDDDILPDPSEIAIPLYGDRKTFSRVALDPNALLNTTSLGVSPVNTTLTITYRAGGGLNNNVASRTIRTISSLLTSFNQNVPQTKIAQIRASLEVNNLEVAKGGEDIPTIDELRSIALNYRNAQSRIVTKQDLVSRVYTMPSNFGRVYRVGVRSSPVNPLATQLFIVSRDVDGYLVTSPDTLKRNLAKYLNQFRLTSDAIDILDSQVVNYQFYYTAVLDQRVDKTVIIASLNSKISNYLAIKNFQIDQPIVISDIINLILNQDGVISLEKYKFDNVINTVSDRQYSNIAYNLTRNTQRGIIKPPAGGIFELRYPDFDIIGNAV